jgi:small subunit ribosomal protein S20
MPIIKSAKKRVRVSAKAAARNSKTKRSMREAIKAFTAALATGKPDKIQAAQAKATGAIDKAAKKNVIHKNKAARKKHQLSLATKKAVSSPQKSTAKQKTTKAVAKKATAKKPAAKKPAAKKLNKNYLTLYS